MPTGYYSSSVILLDQDDSNLNISVNLRSYAFDFSLEGYLITSPVKGNRSLTSIDLESVSRGGNFATAYSDVFYNHIWILPSTLDLSGVPSGYSTQFTVWNSYFVSKTLNSITFVGTGLDVIDPTFPDTYTALQTKQLTLFLTPNPPASLSGIFSFVFGSVPVNATLSVSGTLAVIYSFRHNWTSSYIEKLAYKTNVIESNSGVEQRIKLNNKPRRFYQVDSLLADNNDIERSSIMSALHANQIKYGHSKSWLIKIDCDVFENTNALSIGDTVINTNTTVGLDIVNDGYLGFYNKFDDYEVVRIASYTSNTITLQSPGVQRAWPAGSTIYPIRNAYMFENTVNNEHMQKHIKLSKTNWLIDTQSPSMTARVTTYSPSYSYRSYDVWIPNIDESDNISLEYFTDLRSLDTVTGNYINDPRYSMDRERFAVKLLMEDKAAISKFYGFLEYRQGRLKPFWIPTEAKDLQIVNTGTSGSQVIKIKDIGYATYIKQDSSKRDVALFLNDGSVLFRRITGSVNNGDGTEDLSLDTALGISWDSSTFKYVSFLKFCRLDSDEIEIEHITNSVARANINLVTLVKTP